MLTIEESMADVEEVATLDALRSYIKRRFDFWQPTDDNIEFVPWGFDHRIGWDTYLITVDKKAALFCDGPFANDEDFPIIERLRKRITQMPADTLLPPVLEWLEDYEHTFELRRKADIRAIKRWQQAHPGSDHIWPDSADLCVWLMEQHDAIPTPGIPARSQGNSDAAISNGPSDHGDAVAPRVDQPRS